MIEFIRDGEMWGLLDHRRGLQLLFRPWGDQFEHLLGFDLSNLAGGSMRRGNRDYERVVQSVEGVDFPNSREDLPQPSPVYQEIAHQVDGDNHSFLLIGRHGHHHYSAVFALGSDETTTTLDVDVADRCRRPSHPLTCSYAVRSNLPEAESSRASWTLEPGGHVRIAFETRAGTALTLADHSLGKGLVQAIAPASVDGHTTRCRYVWRWTDAQTAPHAR